MSLLRRNPSSTVLHTPSLVYSIALPPASLPARTSPSVSQLHSPCSASAIRTKPSSPSTPRSGAPETSSATSTSSVTLPPAPPALEKRHRARLVAGLVARVLLVWRYAEPRRRGRGRREGEHANRGEDVGYAQGGFLEELARGGGEDGGVARGGDAAAGGLPFKRVGIRCGAADEEYLPWCCFCFSFSLLLASSIPQTRLLF